LGKRKNAALKNIENLVVIVGKIELIARLCPALKDKV
jgi:hypothetical protein